MWHDLMVAFALMMVVEGVGPFLSPHAVREALLGMARLNDRALRVCGLLCMIVGVVTLYWIR